MASRAEPSGRSVIIRRTTAFLSCPSSASAWSSIVLPPAGTSITNDTVPVVAKSSGPIAVPSGLVPKLIAAAASAGSTDAKRLCREHRSGGAAARGRRRRRPAPAPARLVRRRGARHDARISPDHDGRHARARIEAGERQIDLRRTRRGRRRRAAPASRARTERVGEPARGLDLERRVVETSAGSRRRRRRPPDRRGRRTSSARSSASCRARRSPRAPSRSTR